MAQQRLLAVRDNALQAYSWRAGLLGLEQSFAADERGWQQWETYVRGNRQAVFSVFAALAEESLLTEEIPYAHGADRRALLERKLAQRYPGAAWKFSRSLGRNRSGRGDEKILLAALKRPESLAPWLAPLQRAEARLAGIYTAPLLAESLAAELTGKHAGLLLVALLDGGLQQAFFDHGQLRFSRVVAADTADAEATGAACAGESATLRRYLVAQRLVGADSPLPVVVLLHPRDFAAFRAKCADDGTLSYSFADLPALSRKQGLRSLPEDSRSDPLFLHLTMRRTTPAQYAPPGQRRFYHLGRVRSLLAAATVALVLGSLGSAALDLGEQTRLDNGQGPMAERVPEPREDYRLTQAKAPQRPLDPGALRAVVEHIDRLRREADRLPEALAQISVALDQTPGVELQGLEWSEEGEAAARGAKIDIHASLPLLPGDDTAAQAEAVRAFAATLRRTTGLAVDTLQWPAAIAPQRALSQGDIDRVVGEPPRFVLRLAIGAK